MEFICQKNQIEELKKLAQSDRHSVLIEGLFGTGKTYLAKQYAKMLNIDDFIIVSPKVNDIKETIDSCLQTDNRVLLCIENLDLGVPAASYALLKFLEEPLPYVYIVVTCRSLDSVPGTIPSRSTVVRTNPPTENDLELYAKNSKADRYIALQNNPLLKCVKTFTDMNTVLSLDVNQLKYFESLNELSKFTDSISSIVWKLGHYENNDPTPVELVIRYIMEICNTRHIEKCGIDCIRDLSLSRVAAHAVLAKFAFNCKYCE